MRSPTGLLVLLAAAAAVAQPGLAQPRKGPVDTRFPANGPVARPPGAQPTRSPDGAPTAPGASEDAAHAGQQTPAGPSHTSMTQKQTPAPGLVGMVGADGRAAHQVTPGGVYRLVGSAFGDAKGQVRLLSPRWPGGVEYLTVLSWTDGEVQVAMPSDISEQPDFPVPGNPRDTLTLQLTTAAGQIYTLAADLSFYAGRQVLSSTPTLVQQMVDLSGADQSWPLTIGRYTPAKGVYRYKSGSDIGCPNPGRDVIRMTLHNNWALKGYLPQAGTPPFGNPNQDAHYGDGSTTVSGPGVIGGDPVARAIPGTQTHVVEFTVDWGVYRSHHSGPMTDDSKRDECTSQYFLMISLEGPVGTDALRDWSEGTPAP